MLDLQPGKLIVDYPTDVLVSLRIKLLDLLQQDGPCAETREVLRVSIVNIARELERRDDPVIWNSRRE
jgi:hypothetical protein